jgi:hypothetical protein
MLALAQHRVSPMELACLWLGIRPRTWSQRLKGIDLGFAGCRAGTKGLDWSRIWDEWGFDKGGSSCCNPIVIYHGLSRFLCVWNCGTRNSSSQESGRCWTRCRRECSHSRAITGVEHRSISAGQRMKIERLCYEKLKKTGEPARRSGAWKSRPARYRYH